MKNLDATEMHVLLQELAETIVICESKALNATERIDRIYGILSKHFIPDGFVTPPASTESKSLGKILYAKKLEQYSISIPRLDMRSATWEELGEHGQASEEAQAQAIASHVSLRYKRELAELQAAYERAIIPSDHCMSHCPTLLDKSLETQLAEQDATIQRLTLLANENAVLAVEREAEIARLKEYVRVLTDQRRMDQ